MGDGVELVPAGGLVERLREVKDEGEVAAMAEAAKLGDSIYEYVAERGLVGRTEREVAVDLEREMRERGAQDPSFPSIVAAGANGALPHAEPRDVEIPRDTLVVLDLGCLVDGMCSDCTRTFATGELGPLATDVYDLVLNAQVAALDAARVGTPCREVDAAARSIIEEAGRGDQFGHGLGHGVGLEVHEGPRLTKTADGELRAGNAVTIEPGVYVPGRGRGADRGPGDRGRGRPAQPERLPQVAGHRRLMVLAAAAAFTGASVQSATGFGFALVLSPALFAVLEPFEARVGAAGAGPGAERAGAASTAAGCAGTRCGRCCWPRCPGWRWAPRCSRVAPKPVLQVAVGVGVVAAAALTWRAPEPAAARGSAARWPLGWPAGR